MSLVPMYTIMAVNHLRNNKRKDDEPKKQKDIKCENKTGSFHTKDGMFRYIGGDQS